MNLWHRIKEFHFRRQPQFVCFILEFIFSIGLSWWPNTPADTFRFLECLCDYFHASQLCLSVHLSLFLSLSLKPTTCSNTHGRYLHIALADSKFKVHLEIQQHNLTSSYSGVAVHQNIKQWNIKTVVIASVGSNVRHVLFRWNCVSSWVESLFKLRWL